MHSSIAYSSVIDPLLIYNYLDKKKAVFAYVGELDHGIINSLLKTMKEKLTSWGVEYKLMRRIYGVLVETMENVSRHGIPLKRRLSMRQSKASNGMFMLSYEEKGFCITTGNYIRHTFVEELSKKIEHLKTLDNSVLKELYRKKLLGLVPDVLPDDPDDDGAGVGILDIAIKTDKNFEHAFVPVNNKISMFIMNIRINTN